MNEVMIGCGNPHSIVNSCMQAISCPNSFIKEEIDNYKMFNTHKTNWGKVFILFYQLQTHAYIVISSSSIISREEITIFGHFCSSLL